MLPPPLQRLLTLCVPRVDPPLDPLDEGIHELWLHVLAQLLAGGDGRLELLAHLGIGRSRAYICYKAA